MRSFLSRREVWLIVAASVSGFLGGLVWSLDRPACADASCQDDARAEERAPLSFATSPRAATRDPE